MSFDSHAYPQDAATGIEAAVDWDDAGAFAQLAHDLNTVDYVLDGYEFTPDWNAGILNVSGGVARLSQPTTRTNDHSDDDGPGAKTLHYAAFIAQVGPSGDLALTGDAVNHVWLRLDQSTNDRVHYHVSTGDATLDAPALRLGTVDTAAERYSLLNRLPSGQFEQVTITAPPTDMTTDGQ